MKIEKIEELKKETYRPLRDIVDHQCRPQGFHGIASYKYPELSEEELDRVDDWYCIGLPYALVVYHYDDIPLETDYSYAELMTSKNPVAIINAKSEMELAAEEEIARNRLHA
ncbi:hypothetical protein PA598K_01417 [Paenibacillus sp. 598K]|uniref:hypothetical protein n=1 Tax=Paenibacillus sp. 598K TaxID=1117987 RepID=UPI000FFAB0CA|nr:hypothetical protein [Paenibacillus sp. 598K]GBF73132.1 hypothetical protein PA598K_01417 [Paenibacillus sp. 598K]